MNNNKTDEAALLAGCRGVFQKTSYITFGSKEKPEDYVKKIPPRACYTGKHLSTQPLKLGRTVDVYFEKKHNWIMDGDKYVDKIYYKDKQTEKKRGFLTSDFKKRDEFTNTIRTEQYREQLGTEGKFAKKALEMFSDSAGILDSHAALTPKREELETFLYDSVFEKVDPHFSGASKTHRDTFNKTQHNFDRHFGDALTTHMLTYSSPTEFGKPEHARKPIVRDTFYRRTGILFPATCSADPQD